MTSVAQTLYKYSHEAKRVNGTRQMDISAIEYTVLKVFFSEIEVFACMPVNLHTVFFNVITFNGLGIKKHKHMQSFSSLLLSLRSGFDSGFIYSSGVVWYFCRSCLQSDQLLTSHSLTQKREKASVQRGRGKKESAPNLLCGRLIIVIIPIVTICRDQIHFVGVFCICAVKPITPFSVLNMKTRLGQDIGVTHSFKW